MNQAINPESVLNDTDDALKPRRAPFICCAIGATMAGVFGYLLGFLLLAFIMFYAGFRGAKLNK